ncbi:hypothetical protein [Poseidonocella sedimentorum]|uniref:Uncharacterized protein n=1 Tax=Poseidonocella sedimentorum TaxID=871652 RepID=A0A1I6EFW1_9RHOB|nr:hypothetical protein [Poseidonocella sedimentorum]SFR16614.1 hypothetical protein SAMN04515673_11175 [Poseidonocella sedimentorum]
MRMLAALFLCLLPGLLRAADLTVLVDRRDDELQLFVRLPAADLEAVFGLSPAPLADAEGRVSFARLREEGTYEFTEVLAATIGLRAGGAHHGFEAMSVMVHPPENALPFATPLDGLLAMSACIGTDTAEPPRVAELELIGGFITYPVAGLAEVMISLPNREALEAEVLTFKAGVPLSRETVTLPPRGTITLPAAENWIRRLLRRLPGPA